MIPPDRGRGETEPTGPALSLVMFDIVLSYQFPSKMWKSSCSISGHFSLIAEIPGAADQLSDSIILFIRLRKQDKRKIEVFTFVFS